MPRQQEVAMTNGITSTATTTDTSSSLTKQASIVGKDDFLKLLTFQMKNQNPLKPYDNQEFAAQLAQFSQLEQLVDIKSLLEETANINSLLSETMANSALPGMLGKSAKALTDEFTYDGESTVKLGYGTSASAQSGTLTIKDDAGYVVRKIDLDGSDLNSGNHQISWDGKDSEGNPLGAGKYKFDVTLNDSNGSSYSADTFIEGKVEAVRFKGEGTMLVIGGGEVPLGRVLDISVG